MRRSLSVLVLLALMVAGFAVLPAHAASPPYPDPTCSTSVSTPPCVFQGFEIDGDTVPNTTTAGALDWQSPPPNLTHFDDPTGSGDNVFSGGSKELSQSTWNCVNSSAPAKDDITKGDLSFRNYTVGGSPHQVVDVDFSRVSANGNAHIDYEFNQSTTKLTTGGCTDVPKRTSGDILLSYDGDNGGSNVTINAFKWTGTTFQGLNTGSKGVTFEGAENGITTNGVTTRSDPGVAPGLFGEGGLDLTATIGNFTCGEFATVMMKSRSSTAINSEIKDRTTPKPFNPGNCPSSNLVKAVRVYPNGSFGTTATAAPGDTLEYRLTYTNTGSVAATNVTVTDTIQPKQTYVASSCSGGCTTNGPPVTQLSWSLGTQQPTDPPVVLTFRVKLDSTFPVGTTHVKNTGVVKSTEEPTGKISNETDTTVNASINITAVKSVNPQSANPGDTVHYSITLSNSGNETGTITVVDDYDEAHIAVSNISDNGQNNQPTTGKIQWTNVSVPPGTNTKVLTYDGTVIGTFSGATGGDPCTTTQFAVKNHVTLSSGGTADATLCVNGNAVITAVKSVSPTTANEGDTVHYTITLSNSGNIPGTITVVDDYDEAHITVSNISDNGQDNQPTTGKIQWTGVVVPVGANSKLLTYDGFVHGPFTGPTGGSPCSTTQFKVHNTVTLSSGGGTGADLCVNGHAHITVVKTADEQTANVGDVVHYTITLSNDGNIPGTVSPVDDYDQAHLTVDANSISDGGQDNGSMITWSNIVVPVGANSKTLTYSGTIHGPFAGDKGTCNPGQFPVINTVTITGDSSTNTVCVNASPDLKLVKSADQTQITPGGQITYTLAYSNGGPAEATNVVITETVPAGTTFVSCTGGCVQNGNTVTWNIGTVASNGGGSVAMTVNVTNQVGCRLCNTATISSPSQSAGAQISSNTLCIGNTPAPNPDGAHASGNATGANVQSSLLSLDLTLPTGNDGSGDHTSVDSSQSGLGSNSESNQVLAVDVPPPPPGSVLHADVLRAVTTSTVTQTPSQATATSVGSAANINILNGTVKATLVRGVASARATGTSINTSSIGSAIEGLQVLGIPQAVFPGAKVDLPSAVFGPGSYVAIYEELKVPPTSTPSGSSGGTYADGITVNMIHVHVTNMLLVGAVEVVVGHATAHADFPQTTLCPAQASQSVSGSAYIARVLTDPSIAPILVGAVEIPTSGGSATKSLNTVVVDPLVTSKTATSSTTGSFTSINTIASSYAEAKSLCVLNTPTGCTIAARVVHSQANSTATGISRSSDSAGTDFLGLKVGTLTISLPVAPNTVITLPGIGYVVLNEQFCDNGGTLASHCSDGTVAGHTGITVRGIHLVLLDPAAGGAPGVDVIVAEAHSDARFV